MPYSLSQINEAIRSDPKGFADQCDAAFAQKVTMAAEKASGGESAKAGKGLVQASFLIRTFLLFLVMFALLKSGLCSVFALVLPLLFVRPILIVEQFFQKDGEAKS